MAIDLTLKSTAITNRQATPPVLNNPGIGGPGIAKEVNGYLASLPASLSVTSVIRMVQVPSNAVVSSVRLFSAAQTAGAFDIGVYRTNSDGGAVVDVDLFGSAVSVAAAVDGTEVSNESTNYTIAKRNQQLWEAAGLTEDPKCDFDIALTCATTAVTTGLGAIGLNARYVL
ncbi:hypothetical protein [Nitrosovibrio sp. Nv4]|uniref:hypothetical protein n=1 Tax=Nitrosovibrio sp. Nv4 TaxID=1945880 RepID=UPI000BD2C256|nr:hypothetical protein [Nitrosovibrio sp. Nv4]SOD41324.1 hypothetical protein SAMN06298226_1619 [Nitrosovibrio sp. Nv4]